MNIYNKLVRDRIPEIIEESGKKCSMRILNEDEYLTALEQKLNEEVAEYQTDKNIEEMADILEVDNYNKCKRFAIIQYYF